VSAGMNHLDIAKIVQVIDDYFLLFDSQSTTSIKAKKKSSASVDGLIIYRELRNGSVEVIIDACWNSKEDITVRYHKKGSKSEHDGYESLTPESFSLESITNAIRQMILYDCEVRKPNINDLVLSPNNKDIVLSPKDKTIC
jgi:hypothetical protein